MIKNIFFDFNGTLLDDVFLTFDIENKLAKKYGVPPFSMEKYLDVFCFPVRDYYEKIGFDLSKIDFNKLSHEFMDEFYKRKILFFQKIKNCVSYTTYLTIVFCNNSFTNGRVYTFMVFV